MGGRGSSSGGGVSLSSGGGTNVDIVSETDVWSYRHNPNNEKFVDDINTSVSIVQKDFRNVMDTVNTVSAAELRGADKRNVLGYYGQGGLAINANYTDPVKMNQVYDKAIAQGYHPNRGNKSGTEATTFHEMGHALADHLAPKLGVSGTGKASKKIVDNAYKTSGGKGGTLAFAGTISKYAQKNYSECLAEAVADWYCNGNKATKASKAIVHEMKRINTL